MQQRDDARMWWLIAVGCSGAIAAGCDSGTPVRGGHDEVARFCGSDHLLLSTTRYCPMATSCNYGGTYIRACSDGLHCVPGGEDASCADYVDAGASDASGD